MGLVLLVLGVAGCASTPIKVDVANDRGATVMGLDYRDFEEAASNMIESLLASGALNHPDGARYVLTISNVTNDTMQRIDTDQLVKKIRVAVLNSGKAVITTAVGGNGAEDSMSYQARQLRENQEFDQSRVAAQGRMIAPDFSLSGKIIQRNNTVDRWTTQVDYYFMLSLTDIDTGLAFWEDETPIVKRGSSRTVTW
jgi:uncharacterized protein (TIGR02722 family)